MSLVVDIRHQQGAFTLQARFESHGHLTALFGRSGAGKTTLVNAISGLLAPREGRIVVDGQVLFDADEGIAVPPHRRRIGYVFQEGRLFPHLSVRQNLLFGRWFTPRERRAASFDDVVAMLGIDHLTERRPATLSGGEKQRVAIGRALLADPQLLLMDEPLASLDDERKAEIYPYIERLRDAGRVPIVYVTHSVAEIARLSTSIVLLSEGRVTAAGPSAELLRDAKLFPQFGAAEAGAVVDARVASQDDRYDLTLLEVRAGTLTVPRLARVIGAALRIRVRARDVILSIRPPTGLSALNVLPGRIIAVDTGTGPSADVTVDCAGDRIVARLTRKSVHEMALRPGLAVHAIIKGIAFEGDAAGAPPA
ncbi:molybdenum ABC transporter ATP-binding protein [Microvirga antarctica]|uniref:molybdenum ABC transporter ATP-binding protein n=1 Tax=Microvirga antarctica TaxID=2819233 RepID=UPI001B30B350|nr:molybdenum ABC transporter ATP-binding protein [Microvirga antarctica]